MEKRLCMLDYFKYGQCFENEQLSNTYMPILVLIFISYAEQLSSGIIFFLHL